MSNKHKIEEAVRVYLRLNDAGTAWEIDPATFGALWSEYERGPINEDCDCGDDQACEAAREAASELSLPSGEDLFALLGEALA